MARKKIDVEITKIDPDHIVKWLDRLYDLVVEEVLALFTVGHMYASLCKSGAYAPFSAKRRSRALFWLQLNAA